VGVAAIDIYLFNVVDNLLFLLYRDYQKRKEEERRRRRRKT